MKYTILSPDGFSINHDGGFHTLKEARIYFKKWIQGFSGQGYYSSPKWGRIPVEDIESYCDLIKN